MSQHRLLHRRARLLLRFLLRASRASHLNQLLPRPIRLQLLLLLSRLNHPFAARRAQVEVSSMTTLELVLPMQVEDYKLTTPSLLTAVVSRLLHVITFPTALSHQAPGETGRYLLLLSSIRQQLRLKHCHVPFFRRPFRRLLRQLRILLLVTLLMALVNVSTTIAIRHLSLFIVRLNGKTIRARHDLTRLHVWI